MVVAFIFRAPDYFHGAAGGVQLGHAQTLFPRHLAADAGASVDHGHRPFLKRRAGDIERGVDGCFGDLPGYLKRGFGYGAGGLDGFLGHSGAATQRAQYDESEVFHR